METVRALDELEQLGFDDATFGQLHHFAPGVTIQAHRSYCAKTARFQERGDNALLERRLLYILHRARAERVAGREPDFASLADVAKKAVLPAL